MEIVLCWSSRGLVVGPFFLEILQMREDQSQRGLCCGPSLDISSRDFLGPSFLRWPLVVGPLACVVACDYRQGKNPSSGAYVTDALDEVGTYTKYLDGCPAKVVYTMWKYT